MRKLGVVACAASFAAAVIADSSEYDSYVWLKETDFYYSSDNFKYSFDNNDYGNWQKKNSQGVFEKADAPKSGEKYYVPADKSLLTKIDTGSESSPVEVVFQGEELVLANRLWLRVKRSASTKDDATVVVPKLILLPGGFIYNANVIAASVSGTCTVKGTSENPSCWYNNVDKGFPIFKSKLIGDNDSVFYFKNVDSPSNLTTFRYKGDASQFLGTMRLTGSFSKLVVEVPDNPSGEFLFPGTVDISKGAQFDISSGSAKIGNIASDGGEVLLGSVVDRIPLTVTNCISRGQNPACFSFDLSANKELTLVRLVKFSRGSKYSFSPNDFAISFAFDSKAKFTSYECQHNITLSLSDEDDSRILNAGYRTPVYLDVSDSSTNSAFMGNYSCWSDNSEISSEKDYYVSLNSHVSRSIYVPKEDYIFPGASLTHCGNGIMYMVGASNTKTFTVTNFYWIAGGSAHPIQTYNGSYTVKGKLTIPYVPGKMFCVEKWNGINNKCTFTIASDMYGDGTLKLTLNNGASYDPSAFYAITGLNTNYTGRIYLSHGDVYTVADSVNKEKFTANPDTYCVTLSVSDQRNLGGAMPSFAQDSLLLSSHSLLKTAGSVTFDEPTRGWSVKGVGRISVEDGQTLTVTNKQIAYSGEFRKEGSGLLKLGGRARFTEAASENPLEGTNILSIAAGGLMPADVTAFDGLKICFAENTKLVLDAAAKGDLAKYGLYDVKWNEPLSVAGGVLPVEFSLPEGFDKKACHRFGIVTVNPDAAEEISTELFAVKAPKGMKAKIAKVDNLDESGNVMSVTFACDLAPHAFVIVVR